MKTMKTKKIIFISFISTIILLFSSISYSYERVVSFNNEIITQEDILFLDGILGFQAPNGYYQHDIYGNLAYSINNHSQWVYLGNTNTLVSTGPAQTTSTTDLDAQLPMYIDYGNGTVMDTSPNY